MTAHLLIRDPGLATTLQDLGRRGFQRFGVPPSGALDRESLAEANALAGNPLDTPALELRYLGPVIEAAGGPLRLATAGAALAMRLARATGGEELIEGWQSVTLQPGDRLSVGALRQSATAYLAVSGGFDVAPVLGAAATLTRASLGGFDGGLLQVGARLPLRAP
ncbi:MAG: urea amidolyase, partial [Pseudomonadota bacterium]